MRVSLAFILTAVFLLPVTVRAADARRAQIAAATADALESIEQDLLTAPVTPDLTIGQFIDKTNSRDDLASVLRRAQQIGGTRWLDDQTCQIRMELSGSDVADAVIRIAEAKPRAVEVPVDVLRRRVKGLREMTFAATGISTGAADRLRPPPDRPEWRGVPDDAVRDAVAEARRSAAGQVLSSVETVSLPGEKDDDAKLVKVLSDRKVRDTLESWLMSRPVTSVDFNPNLEVRVNVAADGEGLWDQLVVCVADRKDLDFPHDEKGLQVVRADFIRRVEPTVGRATAKPGRVGAGMPGGGVELPSEPPEWVRDQIEARGSSRAVDGRLKTARVAEATARNDLRVKIEELQLTKSMTLGEAAGQDARLRDAIDRAVERARPRKINYLADGSAEVSFTLDLRDLWFEIAQ